MDPPAWYGSNVREIAVAICDMPHDRRCKRLLGGCDSLCEGRSLFVFNADDARFLLVLQRFKGLMGDDLLKCGLVCCLVFQLRLVQ